MLIRQADQVPADPVTVPGASRVTMRLLLGRRDGVPNFAMRLFELSPGGHTPLHQHNYEHEVFVLQGQGHLIRSSDGSDSQPICAGNALFIPANQIHQFRNTSDSVLKLLCLIPTHYSDASGQRTPTPGS